MTVRQIHTAENLRSDLRLLGVKKNTDLVVHASLRSIGKVEGGYRNFVEALLKVIEPEGSIIAPAFNYQSLDPIAFKKPESPEDLQEMRDRVKPFDIFLTKSQEGSLGDIIRLDIRGVRSNHPAISWAVMGPRSIEYTENTPLDDCDGLDSPIGRAYQRGKCYILLIGVDHSKNTSIHLAEALAKSPHYLNEELTYKDSDGSWKTFKGCGDCSRGFYKVRGLIDFTKYEIKGKVGNALTYLIEQKPFVDAVRDVLREKPWALLCDNPYCKGCGRARKIYGLPQPEPKEYHLKHPWAQKDEE